MIVYEKDDSFIMIAQHDHAQVSGDLVSMWRTDLLMGNERRADLVYAAYQHDRGWIDLDSSPFWNDARKRPYSFRDFPLQPRFVCYTKGIDEVQQKNEYSALLCSLLYTTLFERIKDEKAVEYIKGEYSRQKTLKARLHIEDDRELQTQLRSLLICDELSLFLCMERPGTPTEQYEFFSKGLNYSLNDEYSNKIHLHWINKETVQLSFDLFQQDAEVLLPYKEVNKAEIDAKGILKAYQAAAREQFRFVFIAKAEENMLH
jgi:hypothetical protein